MTLLSILNNSKQGRYTMIFRAKSDSAEASELLHHDVVGWKLKIFYLHLINLSGSYGIGQ